tara:strand:- start:283 stop:408 length:126 start_codon:yes stop_codon:yes gene_type:complete
MLLMGFSVITVQEVINKVSKKGTIFTNNMVICLKNIILTFI